LLGHAWVLRQVFIRQAARGVPVDAMGLVSGLAPNLCLTFDGMTPGHKSPGGGECEKVTVDGSMDSLGVVQPPEVWAVVRIYICLSTS
jgi:hypothetical protein